MAGLLSTIASLLVEIGADTSKLKAGMDDAVRHGQRTGEAAGSSFAAGFSNPLLNAIAGLRDLRQGATDLGETLATVTGSRVAAEMGVYRRQLQAIAGDFDKANAAAEKFNDIASDSNYNREQVFSFGLKQAGRTGDVSQAAAETQLLLDAATALGVTNQKFQDFQFNVGQIQDRGAGKVDERDLREFRDAAPLATKQIADSMGISIAQATAKLGSASGSQFMKMIEAVGARNAGAAAAAAARDPYAAGNNVIDDSGRAMESTGRDVNAVLTPLIVDFGKLVKAFGDVNDSTYGAAGLVGVLAAGTLAVRRFGSGLVSTIGSTVRMGTTLESTVPAIESLTAAINQMTGAAEAGAIAARTEAEAEAVKSGATASGAAAAGAVAAGGAAVAAKTGLAGAKAFAMNAAPYLVGAGLMYAGGKLSEDPHASDGQKGLAAALKTGGTGVGIGAMIGSMVPIIGTAAGAAIGGLVGGGYGLVTEKIRQNNAEKTGGGKSEAQSNTDALKENTNAIKSSSSALGGGARTRSVTSQIEMQYAVYALMHAGQTGIG